MAGRNCVVQRETRAASHTSANRINRPPLLSPLWNCLLTEDRWLPFDFHLSRNSPFDLPTIRGRRLIAPETRPIPETRTRGPIPRLFIHPQRTTWNELNFWSFIVIFRYLSTIFQLKAIELLYVMIRLLEFDYHGQSCQSKILFRFNFSIFSLGMNICISISQF